MGSRKVLYCILGLVMVLIFATGVSAKTTIRFWGIPGGPQGEALKAIVDAYTKAHPDVVIETKEGTLGLTDVSAFLAAITAGQAPELVYWDRFTVGEFAARGAFMPLDEMIERSNVIKKEDILPYALKEATFEGHIYAIPHDAATHGLVWNKQHYAEAGLDPEKPPKDMDEFISYTKKLTKYDSKGHITRLGDEASEFFNDPTPLVIMMNGLGADWVSKDGRKCTVNDERVVKSLQKIVEFVDALGGRTKIQDFISAQEVMAGISYFATGLTSQYYRGGLWLLAQVRRANPGLAEHLGLAASPPMPGGAPKSFMGGFSFVIPRGTPKQKAEETMRFVEFALSLENMLAYAKHCTKIPVYNSAINSLRALASAGSKDLFAPALWKGFLDLTRVGFGRTPTPFNFLIYDELRRATDAATFHQMSPKAALDKAAANVQKELDRFYKSR